MSYHETSRQLNLMIKAYGLKPEHLNMMIKFAKAVRRSARQNKVLWNMVDIMTEGTNMKLVIVPKVNPHTQKTYDSYRVFGTAQPENLELQAELQNKEPEEADEE